MAAATQSIDTPELAEDISVIPVAAATKIYAGTIVAADANGRAVPAADAANLKVIGRAEDEADNSGGAAGAISARVKRGIFRWNNSGSDAVDADDIGKVCYVADDNTVREGTGTNSIKVGRVQQVDSKGVWVDTRVQP